MVEENLRADIWPYLAGWVAARPDFLWVPDSPETLTLDRARGVVGSIRNGAVLDTGGILNPVANGTQYISFPTNVGITATTNFYGVALVSINNPALVTGCFVKIGDDTTGVGFGGGNTTFEDLGSNLIVLREGIAWAVSSPSQFKSGLNEICFGANDDAGAGANHPITTNYGSGIQAAAPYAAPSSILQIQGYVTNRTSASVVHAVAIYVRPFANNAAWGGFGGSIKGTLNELLRTNEGSIRSLFTPRRRRVPTLSAAPTLPTLTSPTMFQLTSTTGYPRVTVS